MEPRNLTLGLAGHHIPRGTMEKLEKAWPGIWPSVLFQPFWEITQIPGLCLQALILTSIPWGWVDRWGLGSVAHGMPINDKRGFSPCQDIQIAVRQWMEMVPGVSGQRQETQLGLSSTELARSPYMSQVIVGDTHIRPSGSHPVPKGTLHEVRSRACSLGSSRSRLCLPHRYLWL